MVTESHMASLMRWKSSSVGGCDRVRWLPLRLRNLYDILGGDSGQEEQKALVSRPRAPKFLMLAEGALPHVCRMAISDWVWTSQRFSERC